MDVSSIPMTKDSSQMHPNLLLLDVFPLDEVSHCQAKVWVQLPGEMAYPVMGRLGPPGVLRCSVKHRCSYLRLRLEGGCTCARACGLSVAFILKLLICITTVKRYVEQWMVNVLCFFVVVVVVVLFSVYLWLYDSMNLLLYREGIKPWMLHWACRDQCAPPSHTHSHPGAACHPTLLCISGEASWAHLKV